MTNTDFLNLSLPDLTDKIDVTVLNNDFKALEKNAEKHVIAQEITIDETAIINGVIGPYIEIENMTEEIVEVDIADEILLLQKDDKRKVRTISAENVAVATSGVVKIKYFTNAKHYVDENYYSKEKIDELIEDVDVEVDAELSESSENPVQNKVVTAELAQRLTQQETIALVVEKVAEIVAGAPEDFDTLKELSDWLLQHEDSAATMNTAIQKNKTDIETANTNIAKNTADIETINTRISAIEPLSDAVYKYHKSSYCSIDGYVLRVGNQVHLNLTATVHTACNAWVGSILILPFKVKTPDGSQRYTIKQTQTDEREISIYISNGSNSFFSSTALQRGDIITIPPMILEMYVEETATTEGGE